MKAVRFDRYGGSDVLEVRDVDPPQPAPGRVLVRVRATAINPGEASIREGRLAQRWPTTFPSGEGSDLAGVVEQLGDGVGAFSIGDEVCGWTDERAAHAELVSVPVDQLAARPGSIPWNVAGSLFVAPFAAFASVDAVAPKAGETVVVSAAGGGVGSVAVQLARLSGATVIGLAGERNHAWLRSRGIVPVAYGDGQSERIREAAPAGVDAFIDTFGGGYVDLAVALGVPADRINTIADFDAVQRLGVKSQGSSQIASKAVLDEIVGLVASARIEIPIAGTYSLSDVRAAYDELAHRHTHGKIVLLP
jgi:NADPH:quinone reductase-like Zn-dependent oxidoreductase